jgi:hypothetical protein
MDAERYDFQGAAQTLRTCPSRTLKKHGERMKHPNSAQIYREGSTTLSGLNHKHHIEERG